MPWGSVSAVGSKWRESKGSKIGQRETMDYGAVVMDLSQPCSELQNQKAPLELSHLKAKGPASKSHVD